MRKEDEFPTGWLVGDFEPSILRTQEIEVGLKRIKRMGKEPLHHQIRATEVTLVVLGEIRMGNQTFKEGDIVLVPPLESLDFEALTDCILLALKFPSVPNDKQIGRAK